MSPSPRSVLVTGGGRGIGRACAERLAACGHRVAVTCRTSAAPPGLFAVECDVRDPEAVRAAFDSVEREHGPVEVAVVNAGITRDTLLLRMDEQDWAEVVETNLSGAYRVARRATRSMLRSQWGRLVFVSSVVGMSGSPGQANYAAAKAGMVGLARSLARELAPRGITANVVAPGLVDTDMTAGLATRRREQLVAQTPLARVGTAAEVAHVVAFLADERSGFITGAVLPVDGGLGMGH